MVRKYSGPLQKGKRSAYVPGTRKNRRKAKAKKAVDKRQDKELKLIKKSMKNLFEPHRTIVTQRNLIVNDTGIQIFNLNLLPPDQSNWRDGPTAVLKALRLNVMINNMKNDDFVRCMIVQSKTNNFDLNYLTFDNVLQYWSYDQTNGNYAFDETARLFSPRTLNPKNKCAVLFDKIIKGPIQMRRLSNEDADRAATGCSKHFVFNKFYKAGRKLTYNTNGSSYLTYPQQPMYLVIFTNSDGGSREELTIHYSVVSDYIEN